MSHSNNNNHLWPKDVGILAIEFQIPSQFVDQRDLANYDRVPSEKYTIGLGQKRMGFCSDREDIQSLCLSVVHNLLEHHNIDLSTIGRLEVGTETLVDKSKSVKTTLMQLFENCTNIEGLDTTNACYGGTSALFNAINWMESSSWDGRLAIVVCGDIAVYDTVAARPTGGAGACAMLIGPNAPLIVDRGVRSTYMKNVYDFYKPNLSSEYPIVDGRLSLECYLNALDHCYNLYKKKYNQIHYSSSSSTSSSDDGRQKIQNPKTQLAPNFTIDHFHSIIFHSPYCKLVEKAAARLCFNDFLSNNKQLPNDNNNNHNTNNKKNIIYPNEFKQFENLKLTDTYFNADIQHSFMEYNKTNFDMKVKKSLLLSQQIGNMYTASLYSGLVSLLINYNFQYDYDDNDDDVNLLNNNYNNNNNNIVNDDDTGDDSDAECENKHINNLLGKSICLFSYGSGLAASMFSITVTKDFDKLKALIGKLAHIKYLLKIREQIKPEDYVRVIMEREKQIVNKLQTAVVLPYEPSGDINNLFPGTYYLSSIDELFRRSYKRIPKLKLFN